MSHHIVKSFSSSLKVFPLFATGINNTSGIGGKFATGVVDTGGKFSAGVVDTGGEP